MIPVRVNMNLKTLTVEDLESQKRDMHLAAFKYQIQRLEREAAGRAEDEREAAGRAEDEIRRAGSRRFRSTRGRRSTSGSRAPSSSRRARGPWRCGAPGAPICQSEPADWPWAID